MAKISTAALDYTRLILAEYPDAETLGLAVSVQLPILGGNYSVTVVPVSPLPNPEEQAQMLQVMSSPQHLPAPEELLLHPPLDTRVSDEDGA